MPVNPSEAKFFAEAAKQTSKPLSEISLNELRAAIKTNSVYAGTEVELPKQDSHITVRDGYQAPIRIYNSHLNHGPFIVFYPGCGYIYPLFEWNCIIASRIAKLANSKLIVINHRLAPEYPLATAIYDAYDATQYIYNHPQKFGIEPQNLILCGLSSGAHCAATISTLAQTDSTLKIRKQILLNGMYDLTRSLTAFKTFEQEDKSLTPELLAFQIQFYGLDTQQLAEPLYSPYFAKNIAKLPETIIISGEYDGMRSDSEAYYEKLKANDVNVKKIILSGQTHNTIAMRAIFVDGVDPAEVIADNVKKNLL